MSLDTKIIKPIVKKNHAEGPPKGREVGTPRHPGHPIAATLRALNRRANTGDESALTELSHYLQDHPSVVDHLGDLARTSELALIAKCAGDNLAVREALLAKLQAWRTELVGDRPSAIEKAAADRVICCWLDLHLIGIQFGVSPDDVELCRKLDGLKNSASRRYDLALKSLNLVLQNLSIRRGRGRTEVRPFLVRFDTV